MGNKLVYQQHKEVLIRLNLNDITSFFILLSFIHSLQVNPQAQSSLTLLNKRNLIRSDDLSVRVCPLSIISLIRTFFPLWMSIQIQHLFQI